MARSIRIGLSKELIIPSSMANDRYAVTPPVIWNVPSIKFWVRVSYLRSRNQNIKEYPSNENRMRWRICMIYGIYFGKILLDWGFFVKRASKLPTHFCLFFGKKSFSASEFFLFKSKHIVSCVLGILIW